MMSRHTRLHAALLALVAALLMALGAGAASARNLSIDDTDFRIIWSLMIIRQGGAGGDAQIGCPVTLTGTFHRATIVKSFGALIGTVRTATNGPAEECIGGALQVQQASLPWHVVYDSFTGTLPNIRSVMVGVVGAGFTFQWSGFPAFSCLLRTRLEQASAGIFNLGAGGTVINFRWSEPINISAADVGMSAFCDDRFFVFQEVGTVDDGGGSSLVFRLI